jgi:hypothetical protein
MEARMRDESAVRVFVLDYLRHGPSRLDDLFRDAWSQFAFTREEIAEAGRHLGIVGKKLDGVSYVMKPHNLVGIWWAKTATGPRFIGTASEGNAA